jgi:pyruvate dehydrogenase E2 component (dihydrolipoamide acetyltransferase)
VVIPPRTRSYLKEKGLLDQADRIPASGSKLMPEDIDRYLASQSAGAATATVSSDEFRQVPLPQSQVVLNYRLTRGAQVCVPVTVMCEVGWSALENARAKTRNSGGPTAFAMSCWCIAQAMKKHEKFRSALTIDGKSLKIFNRINLGVAVARPGDEMVTAVIRGADQLSQSAFFEAFERQVSTARDGQDQVDESTTITVSNIGKAGMRIGIPAIVAPAVATLAIGESYPQPWPKDGGIEFRPVAWATLSFDHRIANGIGAANFLADVREAIERFTLD